MRISYSMNSRIDPSCAVVIDADGEPVLTW